MLCVDAHGSCCGCLCRRGGGSIDRGCCSECVLVKKEDSIVRLR